MKKLKPIMILHWWKKVIKKYHIKEWRWLIKMAALMRMVILIIMMITLNEYHIEKIVILKENFYMKENDYRNEDDQGDDENTKEYV